MARRIASNLFMLIFLAGIISIPVYWIAQGRNYQKTSTVEGKFLSAFKSSSEDLAKIITSLNQGNIPAVKAIIDDQVIHRGLQTTLEQAAAEQFPFRLSAIKVSRFFDRLIIRLTYGFLPDKAIPTDMQSGLYIDRQYDFLTYAPSSYTKSEKRVIDKRIDNYATLLSMNPGIHFHAFYFERLQFSSFHPLNQYFPGSDNGRSFLYFEEGKPRRLLLAKMMLTSLDDHTKYFYRTDHHWNIQGALKAYDIIYSLLASDFTDISPPVEITGIKVFPDIDFLGLYARRSLYPISPDSFEIALYDLPPYKIIQDGREVTPNQSADYLAGRYSNEPYAYHYDNFFGYSGSLHEFIFNNGSNHNLLLISNSFANPLKPLIASHYQHTYCVDLRYYADFSLSGFLAGHKVDDVLILGDNDVVFEANEWFINP